MLLVLTISSATCAQTLVTLDRRILPVESSAPRYPTINALLLCGDTLVVGAWNGVWMQCDTTQEWRKLIGAVEAGDDWWVDCDKVKVYQHLFYPTPLWRIPNSDDIMVYDSYCDVFLRLPLDNLGEGIIRPWWDIPNGDNISVYGIHVQQDLIVAGLWDEDSLLIGLGRTTKPGFSRRIFKYPASLGQYLDSVGENWAYCRPALNPRDSTIWFSINGYRYVYIIDRKGNLLDSLEITAPDFIPPSPPASRMHSNAVYEDWASRWTPQMDFRYVPPGFFLLQYRTGWTKLTPRDSVRLLSTCAWNDRGQPVELDVDSNWGMAGVHSDGRLIFGHFEAAEDQNRIILTIKRIEP